MTASSTLFDICASNSRDCQGPLFLSVNSHEGDFVREKHECVNCFSNASKSADLGRTHNDSEASDSRISIPKTVPLLLESSNDAMPEALRQISPKNSVGGFCFPEVTFLNLMAMKVKNKRRNENFLELQDESKNCSRGKSCSIPCNFVYSEGDFVEKLRKVSLTTVTDETNNVRNLEKALNKGSVEMEKKEGNKRDVDDCSSVDINIDNAGVKHFESPNSIVENLPCLTITDFTNESSTRGCEVDVESSGNVDTELSASHSSTNLPPHTVETQLKPKISPLNHSTSSPSLFTNCETPRHQCKKPKPVVRTDAPRRHRHSVAGHHHNFKQNLSYFKLYGISVGPTGVIFNQSDKTKNKLLGSTSSLFSTAVISGSSSAPNLRDPIGSSTTISGKKTIHSINPH